MSENILVALIAITPTLLTIIITCVKDRKKVSLSSVKKELGDSIKDLKDTMETNDKEIKRIIESNNMESLKRYLVFMLSRAKFDQGFSFNEYEKSIVEESYKIYRNELGNGYVKELYHDCKKLGKL